ncbi:hypothetical protein GOODEAATRI_004252, partial [Goodea atripinnis]
MESLIRGGASRAENLFRSSSKENLVRSASRESLTPLGENEPSGGPVYDPPSDIESEAEDPPGSAEALSKEQLLHRLLQVERSLGKYRGKYSEEQCKKEYEQLSKEREQQASLALEDAELQKNAIRTESDNKVKDIQLELEAARTVS